MLEQTINAFDNLCREILATHGGVLTWKWDPRFESLLIEFTQETVESVRGVLDKHLNYVWEKSSLNQAPEAVQDFGERLGGLMSNQLLFASDTDNGTRIFCAWWPWADQNTISIRLAPDYSIFDDPAKSGLIDQTKKMFGI